MVSISGASCDTPAVSSSTANVPLVTKDFALVSARDANFDHFSRFPRIAQNVSNAKGCGAVKMSRLTETSRPPWPRRVTQGAAKLTKTDGLFLMSRFYFAQGIL